MISKVGAEIFFLIDPMIVPSSPVIQDTILNDGRGVLACARKALKLIESKLGSSFCEAVDILSAIEGRAVVVGMGKSGHIARKIASTLSSTGTSSYYLHPGEANHGDVGVLMKGDVLLALSRSGESPELKHTLQYAQNLGIKVLAITENLSSPLALSASVVLELPKNVEAGFIPWVPTTSSLLTLALGDALAVALMRKKGFSAQDFGRRHPGGDIGRHFKSLKEIMHTGSEIPLVKGNPSVGEAILQTQGMHFGCIGVVDQEDGRLLGVLTDGDLRRHVPSGILHVPIQDVMTHDPIVASPHENVGTALRTMSEHVISALFIVEDGQPVGLVHLHDMVRHG